MEIVELHSFNGDCLTFNSLYMTLLKKEESISISYKDFTVSASGEAIRLLVGCVFTVALLASISALQRNK